MHLWIILDFLELQAEIVGNDGGGKLGADFVQELEGLEPSCLSD
jgi:hypothetical protein